MISLSISLSFCPSRSLSLSPSQTQTRHRETLYWRRCVHKRRPCRHRPHECAPLPAQRGRAVSSTRCRTSPRSLSAPPRWWVMSRVCRSVRKYEWVLSHVRMPCVTRRVGIQKWHVRQRHSHPTLMCVHMSFRNDKHIIEKMHFFSQDISYQETHISVFSSALWICMTICMKSKRYDGRIIETLQTNHSDMTRVWTVHLPSAFWYTYTYLHTYTYINIHI